MRNFTLHKFLAMLLMAVCSATLSVAQNVAKINSTEYATLEEAVKSVAQGGKGYITILADASFEDLSIEGKQIIINLQNHTVTGNKIDVYGTEGTDTYLKILDSKAKGLSVDKNNNYSVSYTTSGTLQLTRSITAYEGACIKVESGTVVSTTSFALLAYGDVTGQSDVASSIEVTGGYVKAQEGCVSPRGRGASVTVGPTKYSERKSMPVLESLDNAAVMGNGTYKANEKLGGTSITISGNCWLIGRIQTSGYAACGIYHPQQGSLSIKYYYGAPNIVAVNGAGIVMRGGTLDYRAGNITATGDASFVGKVGDADAQIGNCGIVYDYDCGYYDTANAKIKITNGYKNTNVVGSKSAIQVFNSKAQDAKQNIADVFDIQGGVFSSDVSAYVNTDDGRETFGHEGTYYVGKFVAQVEGGLKYESFLTAINNAPAGSTVVLLKDRTEQSSGPQIKKDVTIDLNGKNLTLSSMTVNKGGNLTIKDSGTGGTYNGLGANYSIYVREGGIFNLESGTLTNSSTNPKTQNVVVRVVGDATTPVASTANIMGGKIETKGTPVSVFEPGATVNVSGGELKGSGLACIAGNGTKGQGGTTINVSGGTLTAAAADAESAACGIYHPNEGTLNITGGTINVADGVGVLMRGGEMTMTGGEINATGDATRTGSVGDTNQKIGVSGVIFDRDANYPAVATTSIKIDGDAKVSGAKAAVELINDNNVADAKSAFKLKGGTYSSDVSKYCAAGFTATPNADGTYGITKVGDLSVMVAYDKAYDNVEAGGTVDINMDTVNKILVAKAEVANVTTTLTKTFSSTGWNAFFVPFDFTLTAEMLNDFEFAKLYAVIAENNAPVVNFKTVAANDKISAYSPYLIKAKTAGSHSLNVGAVTYKSNAGEPPYTATIDEFYTFYPVMENTYTAVEKGYYLDSEQNSFVYSVNEKTYVPPLRYYMTMWDKNAKDYIVPTSGGASKVKFCVIGEDEPTGITDLVDDAANASGKVYNLQGVVVGNTTEGLPKGVYIKNGRKIIVK